MMTPSRIEYSSRSLSLLASLGLFLILCAKFYYLWGVTNWPQLDAPVWMVAIRDVVTCGFLIYFGLQVRSKLLHSKLFWLVWTVGLLMSLYQLAVAKDFSTWLQHYFRNSLIPMLFFPVVLGLFKSQVSFKLRLIFPWVFWINLVVSYVQAFALPVIDRPRGLFGDPLLNSLVLFWGLVSIILWQRKQIAWVAGIALIPLLQYLSSLSSLVSIVLATLTLGIISRRQWLPVYRANRKRIVLASVIAVSLFVSLSWIVRKPRPDGYQMTSQKFQMLYQSLACQDANCQVWFLKGRIISNLRPFEICRQDLTSCLLGNRLTGRYERLDSTWGSLVANWGAIFCLLYVAWLAVHFKKPSRLSWDMTEDGKQNIFWSLVFFCCVYYALFNAVIYKYPVNIMLYFSMAYLSFQKDRKI
ncbi:MAG: hypothetical protein ACXWC9_09420 [Pseudobdellovibrionaceae bacterium]